MAGQGWREWVAGEQLTDAKMQQFLQDQAVMRFANASARDTALAQVLSEGMVAYLDDLNVVEVYDGTEWTELTGDPEIFTQGTAGQYLQSNGTAGVEWSDIESATPESEGLIIGQTNDVSFLGGGIVKLGYQAAKDSASSGVAIGAAAGFALTTGSGSTFVGEWAGVATTTGFNNTAVGRQAISSNTTGSNNVAVGQNAASSPTASERTVIGSFAGGNGVAGGNTLLGYAVNLSQPITGTNNTILGRSAGNLSSGSNNTIIGNVASASSATVSNEITLGNSSISTLRCQVTSITSLSDARDKENIEELPYGLEFVKALKPVSFDWNTRDSAKVGVPDIGFIAQDLVELEDAHDAERLALTLRNNPDKLEATQGRLIPILVKAIQDLAAEVEELKNAKS